MAERIPGIDTKFSRPVPPIQGRKVEQRLRSACRVESIEERVRHALDAACQHLPDNGGDHETRKFVALRLLGARRRGVRRYDSFAKVAESALADLAAAKS